MPQLTYLEAIRQGIWEEMERDPTVFCLGEDIGIYGGAFKVTDGFIDRFGPERVIDTPIAESAIVGAAFGASLTGMRPVGARTASWDFSPHTLRITKEMGLLYDSSLMADEDCYELVLEGEPTGVVELPVEWVRDDAVYFLMHRFQSLRPQMPPEAVFDIFRREFDAAYEEGGICQITTHPHIIGYRSRIWIIEELIRHAKSRPGVWFATHAQVAAYAKEHAE